MFVSLRNRLCVRKSGFQRQPRCGHFRNNLPFEMVPIPINLAKLVLKISKNDGKLLFYSGLPHVYHRSHQHPKSAQQTISQKRAQNRMNPGPHLKIGGFITVSRRNLLMLESVLNLGKTKLHHKQFYLNIYIYMKIQGPYQFLSKPPIADGTVACGPSSCFMEQTLLRQGKVGGLATKTGS